MRLVSAIYNEFYPFDQFGLFDEFVHTKEADHLRKGDALVVWGGADISPSLYKAKIGLSHASYLPSRRDEIEWRLMQRATELDIPIIGVCRGAQMLCALAGGILIQHVDNHAGPNHMIKTVDGKEMLVNSAHHQMQYPFKVDHELIGWSDVRSTRHMFEDGFLEVNKEPEFVYYPKQKGFGIQWHPEWLPAEMPSTEYVINFIKERM